MLVQGFDWPTIKVIESLRITLQTEGGTLEFSSWWVSRFERPRRIRKSRRLIVFLSRLERDDKLVENFRRILIRAKAEFSGFELVVITTDTESLLSDERFMDMLVLLQVPVVRECEFLQEEGATYYTLSDTEAVSIIRKANPVPDCLGWLVRKLTFGKLPPETDDWVLIGHA